MNGLTRTAVLAGICGMCALGVNAAESALAPLEMGGVMSEVFKNHQTSTRGQSAPMSSKLQFALGMTFARKSELSDADLQALQAFYQTAPDMSKGEQSLDQLCSDLQAQEQNGTPDAYSLAMLLMRSGVEFDQAKLTHYQRQVDSLSPSARHVFDEEMNAINDASIGSSKIDYLAIAAEAPDVVVAQMRDGCKRRAQGPAQRGTFKVLPPARVTGAG